MDRINKLEKEFDSLVAELRKVMDQSIINIPKIFENGMMKENINDLLNEQEELDKKELDIRRKMKDILKEAFG